MSIRATIACLLLASCASTGNRGEPDAADLTPETEPYCGNAIVDEGEECDVYDVPCDGPECPGTRTCLDDCTLGECVSGTFGILAGPTLVNEDVWFEALNRIDLVWAGTRYGVFYSGHRSFPVPWTQSAYFTPADIGTVVDTSAHQILPDLYVIEEVQAVWNPSERSYGIILVTASPDDNLIANQVDEEGNALLPIGILITSEGEARNARLVLGEDGYGVAWQMGPRAAGFARLSDELVILDLINVDSEDPEQDYRMPLIGTRGREYHVLSHVDGPSLPTFDLALLTFPSPPTVDHHAPFGSDSPGYCYTADMVLSGTLGLVVYGADPVLVPAPLVPALLGLYDTENGIDETHELGDFLLLSDSPFDVSVALGDDELGIALTSADREDPSANRQLVIQRAGLDGSVTRPPFHVPVDWDVSMPSIVWDGSAYGVAYAVDRSGAEALVDVELVRLGCQMP